MSSPRHGPRHRSAPRAAQQQPVGHGHGHGPAGRADRRVRIAIAALLVPAALATLIGLVALFPVERAEPAASALRVPGTVAATAESDCSPGEGDRGCAALTVRLTGGPTAGTSIVTLVSVVRGVAPFTTGDDVLLSLDGDPADPDSYQVVDFQRDTPLLVLALLFAAAVVALGRWRGLAALGSLVLTGVVLLGFVLPAILAGRDPLLVAVVGCTAIMFAALYLTHGFSARTSTAVLGTFGSLVLIGVLGVAFAAASRLTGADEDTAALANTLGTAVDGRGLVLAGLMIGALGALDDVTVTQSSAVWELRAANPAMGARALFSAAMRIGRDHVASAVNTLVLAYTGAALPLLLLFSAAERGLADTLTSQVIATEIVRTLVGSIGLVAAVPLTTALAVAVVTRGSVARPEAVETSRPGDEPMTSAARTAVVDLCRGLVERGLVVGTAGNVSVRHGDRFAVSPSGVAYATLTPEMVGVHALDGTPVDSPLPPTSELALHALVHTRPGARDGEVVLHTHAPASTALSTVVDEVPPTHYYAAMFGGAVRVAPYATFGTPELAAHVLDALRGRSAALLANHGAVVVAGAVDGALDRAGYLEYVCDVALRALATGFPLRTLDAAELDRVADALRGYGQR